MEVETRDARRGDSGGVVNVSEVVTESDLTEIPRN